MHAESNLWPSNPQRLQQPFRWESYDQVHEDKEDQCNRSQDAALSPQAAAQAAEGQNR